MVRAPCCEKMGLKKGPWTTEEDQILVSYIQRFGHGNWRALPKQAGLMRCGKSCRLRWMNYLRPDIKRGNFSKEEEDTIINLHEMLGNRWSTIAAKLPGRTDNEIKNVWHTYLKKRLNSNATAQETKRKKAAKTTSKGNKTVTLQPKESITLDPTTLDNDCHTALSPCSLSFSELSSPLSSLTESSVLKEETNNDGIDVKDSMIEFPDIGDSFWSEVMPMENYTAPIDVSTVNEAHFPLADDCFHAFKSNNGDNGMDFWLRVFMEAGDLDGLPEIL